MTSVLRKAGHEVHGIDIGLFDGCDFGRVGEGVAQLDLDVRDVQSAHLSGYDAVIHLAGLSDDGACDLRPELTRQINLDATIHLALSCKRAGVGMFLFASSCSVYGRDSGQLWTERDQPSPISLYAKTKLDAEFVLRKLADESFSPVILRNATVYGVSPRLRLDLVTNEFVATAAVHGRVEMRSVGTAWRPLVHVEDLARGYASVLAAPRTCIHNQTFNVVGKDGNIRIIDLADTVVEHVANSTRRILQQSIDPRSYRVCGEKLRRVVPGASPCWSLAGGIRQLREAITAASLSPGELRSDRYRRVLRLKNLMGRGVLNAQLRRAKQTRCETSESIAAA